MAIDEPAVYCSLDIFPKFNTVEVMQQFDKSMGGVVVDSLISIILICLPVSGMICILSLVYRKKKVPEHPP